MHHFLLLLGVAVVTINGQGTVDAPVSITKPIDLDKPKSLVMDMTLDAMSLTCSAQNADSVVWKFKATPADLFTDPRASSWTQDPATLVGSELTSVLKEKSGSDRTLLNGYYQCVAGNAFGYKAITPPIRILSPSLPAETSQANPISGTEGKGLRLPCYSGSGSLQITPSDYLDFYPSSAVYTWTLFSTDGVNPATSGAISTNDRIKIDPKTGDLFFKFLIANDQAVVDPNNSKKVKEYRCSLAFASGRRSALIGIHRLTVSVPQSGDSITMLYPAKSTERSVTCQEGVTCYLPCMYGGRINGQAPGNGKLTLPGKVVETIVTPTGSSLPNPSSDADGRWICSLDSDSSAATAEIDVIVRTYPAITPDSMVPQVVTTGSKVNFDCITVAGGTTKFYINGNETTSGTPGVTISSNSIAFNSVQRSDSSSISCVVSNNAGLTFKTATLIVYDKASIMGQPVSGYSVPENVTLEEYTFNCSVTLDSKAQNPDIYWRTSVAGLVNDKITRSRTDFGIMKVDITPTPAMRSANLRIKYDSTTKETFRNSTWWCECTFGIAVGVGNVQAFTVTSNKMSIEILAQPKPDQIIAAFTSWWVIGVAAAVIFFVLLIILIICCVRQNKGEQYYVDEKERKAGHNPELELEQKGFQDYQRPDQNPVKGSRASMNFSDKPLDSDTGSIDEYGDIDTGRFNEDGSFLEQYGQKRNQADV